MKKLNAVERSEYINDHYKEYLCSSFQLGSGNLQKLFIKELEEENLFKGPYVALDLPFQRGKNLNELISEGVICESFKKLNNVDFNRPLYLHQEEAIRRANNGRSIVVTTGTGSGKTECFLYPVINDVLRDYEIGNDEPGIRAVFLYPMNVLVNDQIDRLRKMLKEVPEVTFGFFTGDTPETVGGNYREKQAEEGVEIPENELVSRQEIRKRPPHLLFTNYSMLEYLLLRPKDSTIFNTERLNNWKYVILDEAHTYYGSLGIEISLLMRRLTGIASKKPKFILTSATLGRESESEKDILDFANKLTSVDFNEEDIIFSSRIKLRADSIQYRVSGSDYHRIRSFLDDPDRVREICGKYGINTDGEVKECLYNLLIRDENVYDIYALLKSKSKTFREIFLSLKQFLSEKELIDLIELINIAENNGIGIFDLKYHSFIRPLSGAYVTLGETQALTLKKTNKLDGMKAFEIGNCRYCGSPYIIGRIHYDKNSGLDYLYQNDEIDIYENYGDNDHVALDYFLMENAVSDEEVNKDVLQEYSVCGKCGCIYEVDNINANHCDCGPQYQQIIYKISETRDSNVDYYAENNVEQCPCCGRRRKSGVVRSLNLGKDEGTALTAQLLYDAIDEGQDQKNEEPGFLSLKPQAQQRQKITKPVKQFLAFSDSRQQASFSAVFFNSLHVRTLQKRLIWKVIEDHQYKDVPMDELTACLTAIIRGQNLFDNDLTAQGNAWLAPISEILRVDGRYDGEHMGLYYFDLDLSGISANIREEEVTNVFGEYGIDKTDLLTIMKVVFGSFRDYSAIRYVRSGLTNDEKEKYLGFNAYENYVMFKCSRLKKGIKSFLPVRNSENKAVEYIEKVLGCDVDEAGEMLDVLFNNLAVSYSEYEQGEPIFVKSSTEDAYQIDASRYILKNYRTSNFYRCKKCGRLTPYNVHNKCVERGCDGTLELVNPDNVLANNYYRNEYMNKKIEGIVIKEHTAQLDHSTAKKYQQDFKNKKINILSCSTTFEMGVDIGELETVFMRNIPPTPANYVQRAGRAGRRKNSAAYILSYCGTGSHDYTYFQEPGKMISGIIDPPHFNVLNKKIIVRHLMSTCLGYFFRKNPEYFKSIDEFVFNNGTEEFRRYVSGHPEDLNQYINNKVLPESEYLAYHDFKWFDEFGGDDEKLRNLVESIKEEAKEFETAEKEAIDKKDFASADYFSKQLESLHKERVLDCLAKYCVIPKYGFPIDVVDLKIYRNGRLDGRYDLNRDLTIAVSEYAPDSEVIVNGSKYISRYITLPKSEPFSKHYFCKCVQCEHINVFNSIHEEDFCNYCGNKFSLKPDQYFIEPVKGFRAEPAKGSVWLKPKRSYSGDVSYLGGGIKDQITLDIKGIIHVTTSSNDELLVMNKSKFFYCPKCGYSYVANRTLGNAPITTRKHNNCQGWECDNDKLELIHLGHRFQTDVARIEIPLLTKMNNESYSKALSVLYALLEGMSNALGIERRDINGILDFNSLHGDYDILLYDNVPGGAGHVKRLIKESAMIASLKAALNKVSQNCCDEDTSCYNCLRNYYNQSYHNILKRGYARDIIQEILDEITGV